MKLGSLFDGSGGFPLAGCLCGIEPVWASEIEPYPIAVTCSRFPNMKHLGDISKMNGYTIEPVDIITFGSPCQDLSVAGKRAGLKHEENGDEETTRSGLFMEAVRIIKEMRRATNGKHPSIVFWENVPGAFSSSKGEDFRTVLEELIKIVEPKAVVPPVPQGGWPYADSYCGDGWSLAYRVFDAQHWGVPQRRRRIHLVLDLRGERARKVLFEREGLRGYFAEGGTPWKGSATAAEDRIGTDDRERKNAVGFDVYNMAVTGDVAKTLNAIKSDADHTPVVFQSIPYTLKIRSGCEGGGKGALIQTDKSATLEVVNSAGFKPKQGAKAQGIGWAEEMAPTMLAGQESAVCYAVKPVPNLLLDDQGGQQINIRAEMHGNVPAVVCYDARGNGDGKTVNTITGDHENRITDYTSVVVEKEHAAAHAVDCSNLIEKREVYQTLQAKPNGGQSLNFSGAVRIHCIVRRLTPTECARLQGFPDTWGHPDHKDDLTEEEVAFWNEVRNTHAAINGKPTKDYTKEQLLTWYNKLYTDSAEYKMWGNGIALPPALYVMEGIKDALEAADELDQR